MEVIVKLTSRTDLPNVNSLWNIRDNTISK